MIQEIIYSAFNETLQMVPLLLLTYISIELFEYKFGNSINKAVRNAAGAGPILGAIAGALPQCGFSVIATALYTQKLATIGTLLAVYLSTSDEAIPIMLSNPESAGQVLPFAAVKIAIGMMGGFAIDIFLKRRNRVVFAHIEALKNGTDPVMHHHEKITDETACCGHFADSTSKKFNPKEILLHPIIHTARIFVFIFAVTAILGYFVASLGGDRLALILAGATNWQPLLAALVGLIPNCAASVMITQLYIEGAITYGAALAGLCASGGLGLLVLAREEKERGNIVLVISLLLAVSLVAGYAAQFILI